MKKGFIYLLLPFAAMLFTGCFNIIEEMRLNKNGSGNYSVKYDMSGLFTDPMMKSIMMEAMKENADLNLDMDGLEMDSVIFMKDNPEFGNINASEKLKESAKMHIVMSEDKGEFYVDFGFDFEEVNDISAFFRNLSEGNNQMGMGGFDALFKGNWFAFKKKELTRSSPSKPSGPEMNDDELAMMKMFMTNANFKTVYHLPGKVKKCSIGNAKIDGKTVTVSASILDLMENTKLMDGAIRFKRR